MMVITKNIAIKYSIMHTVVDIKWYILLFLEKCNAVDLQLLLNY